MGGAKVRLYIDGFHRRQFDELRRGLTKQGYSILHLPRGANVDSIPDAQDAPGVILEGRRPSPEVAEDIRRWRGSPLNHTLICLVDASSDLPALIKAGADDIVFPPHRPDEIGARLSARSGESQWLNLPPCQVDLAKGVAIWPDGTHSLTAIDIRLLQYFAKRPGRTHTREALLTGVWGYHPKLNTRAVALAISRLRAKIESDSQAPRYLKTVYGVGYRMDTSPMGAGPRTTSSTDARTLYGRTPLLERIETAIAEGEGLIALHGPGGIGKSALARAIHDRSQGGKRLLYCDLSNAQGGDAPLRLIGARINLPHLPPLRLMNGLAQAIKGSYDLVILDGCEGSLGSLEPFLEKMTLHPKVQCLVTSQVRLSLPHTLTLPLPPLDTEAATALFIARAKRRLPNFTPTENTLSAIHDLVLAVDALPLAIELAASWISVLPVGEILQRLGEPGSVDQSLKAKGDAKPSSLSTTLDRSWGLLSTDMKDALAALSVLRASFDLDTAEQILPGHLHPIDTLNTLEAHSVVRIQLRGHTRRFALPRSVRTYVFHRFGRLDALKRHARHFGRAAHQLCQDLHGADVFEAKQRYLAMEADLKLAFSTTCQYIEAAMPPLLLSLSRICWLLGDNTALDLFAKVQLDPEDPTHAEALQMKASFLSRSGDTEGAWAIEATHLGLALRRGDPTLVGQAWLLRATLALSDGQISKALNCGQRSLKTLTAASQWSNRAIAHKAIGAAYRLNGQLSLATSHVKMAISLTEEASATWQAAMLRGTLAIIEHRLGFPKNALENTTSSLLFFQGIGDHLSEMTLLWNLSIFHLDSGDLTSADGTLGKCEALVKRFGGHHDKQCLEASKVQRLVELGRYGDVSPMVTTARAIPGPTTGRWRAYVCSMEAWAQALMGNLRGAVQTAMAGARDAQSLKNRHQEGRYYLMMGLFLARGGDSEGAAKALEQARDRLRDSELPDTPVLLALIGHHLFEGTSSPISNIRLTNFPELRWAQRLWDKASPGIN